jgi:hypothetical protein
MADFFCATKIREHAKKLSPTQSICASQTQITYEFLIYKHKKSFGITPLVLGMLHQIDNVPLLVTVTISCI